MQRRLTHLSLCIFFNSHVFSSGARIARRLANSKGTLQLKLPTLRTLRRRASTFRNTADPVAPCHPKVSGIRGSFGIGGTTLIRGQARAPAVNLSGKTTLALVVLESPNPTSTCLAALVGMAVALNHSNSGDSPPRAISTKTALADTRARLCKALAYRIPCQALFVFAICLVISVGAFG